MAKLTDIQIKNAAVYFLPVNTRIPLKFGSEVLTSEKDKRLTFNNLYPEDFFSLPAPTQLPVWHLVGVLDVVDYRTGVRIQTE